MSDRDRIFNRSDHATISAFHGVSTGPRSRAPTKIDVPQQGAVVHHDGDFQRRRSTRGIPQGNAQFSDSLYGSIAASAAPTSRDFLTQRSQPPTRAGTRSRDVPASRSSVQSSSHVASTMKGKGRQLGLARPSRQRSAASEDIGEPVVVEDSDEERFNKTPNDIGRGWTRSQQTAASGSRALDAKDRKRKQDALARESSSNTAARISRPIALEQPVEQRSLRRRSSPSPDIVLDTSRSSAGQTQRSVSMAARMRPRASSPSTKSSSPTNKRGTSHKQDLMTESVSTGGRRYSSAVTQSSTLSRPANSSKSDTIGSLPIVIPLDRLVISVIWRTIDTESSSVSVEATDDGLHISRSGVATCFSILYDDVFVLECTKADVSKVGLISLSLKPDSRSLREVRSVFRSLDFPKTTEPVEILMIPSVFGCIRHQKIARIWQSQGILAVRWLDYTASRTKIAASDAVPAADWPHPSSAAYDAPADPTRASTSNVKSKRELILPSRAPESKVEVHLSPEKPAVYQKSFPLYDDAQENMASSPKEPASEQGSPPLKKLTIPAKRTPPAPRTAETRSRTNALANVPIVQYPFEGIGAVTLLNSDLRRLDDGELLNDTVIEFAMKLMHEDIRKRDPELAESIYIFNTFFYKILTESKEMESSYNKVRKWTSKIDLFSKKYIVVPINEELHWYLALIVNPHYLLQPVRDPSPPPSQPGSKVEEAGEPLSFRKQGSVEADKAVRDTIMPDLTMADTPRTPLSIDNKTDVVAPEAVSDEGYIVSPDILWDVPVAGPDVEMTPVDRAEDPLPNNWTSSTVRNDRNGARSSPVANFTELKPGPVPDFGYRAPARARAQSSDLLSPNRIVVQDRRTWGSKIDRTTFSTSNRGSSAHSVSPTNGQFYKKPTHIKFDDSGDPDQPLPASSQLSADGNRKVADSRMSPTPPDVEYDYPADRGSQHSQRWHRYPKGELVQNESFSSDRSFDALDGEEIMRVYRGKIEGGGPSDWLKSASANSARNRTRIVPGERRRDSPEPVAAANFYSSSHKKQRRNEHDNMDLDPPNANREATPSRRDSSAFYKTALEAEVNDDSAMDAERCFVITLDSLGFQHKPVARQLREYLWREANDKKRLLRSTENVVQEDGSEVQKELPLPSKPPTTFPQPQCIQSQVPQQPNFCDCGIYLLHYFDRFFSDPDRSLSLAIESARARAGKRKGKAGSTAVEQGELAHWQAGTVRGKRQYWRSRALELSDGWKAFQERIQAERKQNDAKVEKSDESGPVPEDEADEVEVEQENLLAIVEAAPERKEDVIIDYIPDEPAAEQVIEYRETSEPASFVPSPPSSVATPVSETGSVRALESPVPDAASGRSQVAETGLPPFSAHSVELVNDSDDETHPC